MFILLLSFGFDYGFRKGGPQRTITAQNASVLLQ
jgi:hypothetical protein